ncbi:MAG: hypothetical protein WCK75_07145 [Elusimicrobiota bacterium]
MQSTLKAVAAILAVLILSPLTGYANTTEKDPSYYMIKDEVISFTEADSGKAVTPEQMQKLARPANINKTPLAVAGALVNAGASVWGVITSGTPSGGAASSYASATPGFSFDWSDISGWKGPKEIIYNYTVTNLMGIDVIRIKYKISFFYGGTEGNGPKSQITVVKENTFIPVSVGETTAKEPTNGAYITNFTVQPVEINIKWGWKFDLSVKMSDPMNIGTKLRPVAYLQSDLDWRVSNPLSTRGGSWTYGVDGLGNFKDLNQNMKELNDRLPAIQQTEDVPVVNWN